ncbi:MAG: hypothetical protein E7666_04880 [Ruminococcaceae bacterium]|nr:hypothetical protein [Oscillospiraceae bacterium]
MKKLICLLLALTMLATMFVACETRPPVDPQDTDESGSADGSDSSGSDSQTSGSDSEESPIDIPAEDLGTESGAPTEVNMLVRAARYYYLYMDNGDSIDTVERAVFARNSQIEEMFNVDFEIEECESKASSFKEKIQETTSTYYYDIVCWDYYWALEQNGQFADIQQMDDIDTTDIWWHDGWNKNVTINGKQFSISGDAALEVLQNLEVIFFNKQLAEQHQLELYDMVDNGDWYLSKMKDICDQVASNLDDDDASNDFWGALYDVHSLRSGIYSAGMKFVTVAADGSISIPSDNASKTTLVDRCDAFTDLIHSESVNYSSATARGRDYSLFKEQSALFFASCLYIGKDMKTLGLPFDYGILPAPKYNKDADYISTAYGVSIFSIPNSCENQHRAAVILNAMNALANIAIEDGVVWTFYEQVIKGRVADQPEDAVMIDKCRDTLYFDFAFVNEGIGLQAAAQDAVVSGSSLSTTLGNTLRSAKTKLTNLLKVYQ